MTEQYILILLILVCSITFSFEIVFGLAGTILMVTIMSMFIDPKILTIYSILPQVLVAVIALLKSYKSIEFKNVFIMIIIASVGVIIGSRFFKEISPKTFEALLAIVITAAGIFMIISPGFNINKTVQKIMDFSSGLSHSIFAISGPIVMTRLLGTYEDKSKIRTSAFMFYLGINIARIINYTINKTVTPEIWKMFYISAPFLIIVLYFADKLHVKIKNETFKKYVAWIVLFSGIYMLAKCLIKYY